MTLEEFLGELNPLLEKIELGSVKDRPILQLRANNLLVRFVNEPDDYVAKLARIKIVTRYIPTRSDMKEELCGQTGRVISILLRRAKNLEEFWPHLDGLDLFLLQSCQISAWAMVCLCERIFPKPKLAP